MLHFGKAASYWDTLSVAMVIVGNKREREHTSCRLFDCCNVEQFLGKKCRGRKEKKEEKLNISSIFEKLHEINNINTYDLPAAECRKDPEALQPLTHFSQTALWYQRRHNATV